MPRFFIPEPPAGPSYFLGGEEGAHGAKSLRMKPGEEATLCDGAGTDYPCTVDRIERNGLWLRVGDPVPNRAEPPVKVTVCQCLPKGDKLDTVAQKAVELGAAGLWQIESARCIARPDPKGAKKKTARLQRIALEAAKQSGRGVVPGVREPVPFRQALEEAAGQGTILFFYEKGTYSVQQALAGTQGPYYLFIGPEGGFAPEEAALAQKMGVPLLTLGPRILRTETAPLAALAAILYEKGGWEL